jgi:uncharacterized membrane protein YheB (UPF0754 family)
MNMEIIGYISGPLIGGIIGYFTNLIAVKMLFYPRKEIKLLGHVLPFTPGAIPKGKTRLASAVGHAVSDSLLTKGDIEAMLLSEEVEEHVTDAIMRHFSVRISNEICVLTGINEDEYSDKKASLSNALSQEIVDSIDVNAIMSEFGINYFRDKIHSIPIGKLVPDDFINSVANTISGDLQVIVKDKGVSFVKPIVDEKLDSIDSRSVEDIIKESGKETETVRKSITEGYHKLVHDNIDRSMAHIDIASVIEDKINSMDINELERLIMTVMKNELNTIVSLGALIGIIIGLLNNLF